MDLWISMLWTNNRANLRWNCLPHWQSLATLAGSKETRCVAFDLKVPQPGTEKPLTINTLEQEITICFGAWHTHIGTFLALTTAEAADLAVDLAVDMIKGIVAEERIISITYRDGKWSGASLSYIEAPSTPEANSTTEVYSWFGTHDQVILNE